MGFRKKEKKWNSLRLPPTNIPAVPSFLIVRMDFMKKLNDVLKEYDRSTEKFAEHDVHSSITDFRKQLEERDESLSEELVAESMAFAFVENYRDKDTGWGTYYGPFAVFPQDGQWVETPSIQRITEGIVKYWESRAKDASHPILKCRYADLVWDFSKPTISQKPSVEMARIVIDASVSIVDGNHHRYENSAIQKLRRAMGLALSINDSVRVVSVRDCIINYKETLSNENKKSHFGFAYDILFEENTKVPLPEEIENKVIGNLELYLTRVSYSPENPEFDQFEAEFIALRLARYYRRLNKPDDVKRVLLAYGESFLEASKEAAGMVGSAWLQRVHSVYLEFAMNKEAELIAAKLPELGQKSTEEMGTISHEVTIPKEKMDNYVAAMIEGELAVALNRIANIYIPSREKTEYQVEQLSKKFVLQSMMPKSICDERGQAVAHIGIVSDDMEGNVIHRMSQNIGLASIWLNRVLKELVVKFNLDGEKITSELFKSPVFSKNKQDIIEAGLLAFFEEDYLVSIHLLIPQIEEAFRNVVEVVGGPVYKKNRFGGVHLRSMDEILRDDSFVQALGEDASFYFRVLLTDARGWNIRNSVCHGLPSIDTFNPQVADRIIHVLLVLAQLRIE